MRTTFASGCCGAFVFAWTDEWYRGGADVDDWAFGLTDRERQPKPALRRPAACVQRSAVPGRSRLAESSVVVCIYNGEATIKDCCEGLARLDYPDYEVIVVDDGSTDRTAEIAEPLRLPPDPDKNRGLSQREKHRARRGDGRNRRLYRRRRAPRSALADASRGGVHDHRPRGYRRPELPPRRRWLDRRLRGERARRTVACAADGHRGRAHSRLLDGVSERRARRPSAASIRNSAPPATMWMCAGGCRNRAGRSDSTPARWSGTTAGTRSAPTGNSSKATGRRKRCSSGNGRKNTMWPVM